MRIERADEEEEKEPSPRPAVAVARPVPRAIPISAPVSTPTPFSEEDAWVDMPDADYEKRFKRMMRLKEMDLLGMRNKPTTPLEGKPKAGLEVVTLANKLKEEYTALGEASEILNKFSKPNPLEQVLNSEFGKGLGQIVGGVMINTANSFIERQAMRRQQMMGARPPTQSGQTMPPPMPPPMPPNTPQMPPNMPLQPQYPPMQPPPMPPPMPPQEGEPIPQQFTVPPQMKLKLDENDKKLLEDLKGQQDGMMKITQILSEVVQKIDNISNRVNEVEKKAIAAVPSPPPEKKVAPPPDESEAEIQKLFEKEGEDEKEELDGVK